MGSEEKKEEALRFEVSSSPQINHSDRTSRIMWTVVLALTPAALWGVFVFGVSALLVLLFSIGAAVLSEFILNLISGQKTIQDGSAFLTGLLVGMNLPPAVPFYIPVVGSLFAILIVKWTFGGLGKNWANPAIAGRIFVFLSWSKEMATWKMPAFPWKRAFFTDKLLTGATVKAEEHLWDAVSGATPLSMVKEGIASRAEGSLNGPISAIHSVIGNTGYHISSVDLFLTEKVNHLFHTDLQAGFFDPFIGLVPGSLGEVSALLLLLGAVVLFARKIITWEIPLSFIGGFALLVWIFGGRRYGLGLFHGNAWFHVMSGGVMLGALFMATDMVTSPMSRLGMILFGLGCAFLTYLVRFRGSFPEGVSFAILFMNIITPTLDRFIKPKKFGYVKKERKKEKQG